jgi:hypothetical protein
MYSCVDKKFPITLLVCKLLSLYSFTTFGGDWSGQVQASFITDGVINNATFVDIMGVGTNKKVFMKRIQ